MAMPAPNALSPTLPVQLTTDQFQTLSEIPPELEWFANLTNVNTRRAYQQDIKEFMAYAGLHRPGQFREITRAHVIAWRQQRVKQQLANDTIRRKLAALSSLYAYLCARHAVLHNPVLGVKRPRSMNREGGTPPLGDHQARKLLEAPPEEVLKGQRDRAILATLLFHAIRRDELCRLKVGYIQQHHGILYLRIEGKEDKDRYIETSTGVLRLIAAYMDAAGHNKVLEGSLFRPLQNNMTKPLIKSLAKPPNPASG
jgi:integrase/recombinase XerD